MSVLHSCCSRWKLSWGLTVVGDFIFQVVGPDQGHGFFLSFWEWKWDGDEFWQSISLLLYSYQYIYIFFLTFSGFFLYIFNSLVTLFSLIRLYMKYSCLLLQPHPVSLSPFLIKCHLSMVLRSCFQLFSLSGALHGWVSCKCCLTEAFPEYPI